MDHLAFAATEGQPHMQYHYNGNHNFEEEDRDSEVDEKQSFGKMHDGDYGGDVSDERGEDDNNSPKKNLRRKMLQRLKSEQYPDQKLEFNQRMFQTSSRLKDAVTELTFAAESLSDPSNLTEQREDAIITIMQSIVPLLHVAAQTLHDAGIVLSPFAGVKQLHCRTDRKRKREVVDKSSNKRPALQMIDYFIENSNVEIPPIKEISMPNAPLATHVSNATKTASSPVDLPPPKNGVTYTKSEAVETVKMLKRETIEWASALKAMSDKRFIPCSIAYMHTLLQMDEKGQPITDENWSAYLFPTSFPETPGENNDNNAKAGATQTSSANIDGEKIAQNKKPLKLQPYTKSKPARDEAKSTLQDLSQFILPQPKHDSVYSKSEAIAIIKTYKEKSRERGKAIQAMVQRGYVPNSAKSMYRLLYKVEQGIPINDEWNTKGRPSLTKQEHASQQSKPKPPRLAISIQLPKPMNGKIYSKTEAIAVVKPYKAETSERSGAIATMISKGYVPCTTKYLHKLMQRDNEGLPIEDNDDWTKPLKSQAQFILPEPRDGNIYSKSECVEIIKKYKKGSRDRRTAIDTMISKGYVPSSVKTIYRLINRDEEGLPIFDDDWGTKGQPKLLTDNEIDSAVQRLKESNCRTFGMAYVTELLVEAEKARLVKRGEDPEAVDISFSETTIFNYTAIFRSRLGSKYWKDLK